MDDRLGELLAFGEGNPFMDVPDEPRNEPLLDQYFNEIENCRNDLKQMRGNVLELKREYADTLASVDSRTKKKSAQEIDALVSRINSQASKNRERLRTLSNGLAEDGAKGGLNTQERIMKNAHKSVLNEFLDIMQDYQTTQNNYNEKSRDLVKAQVLVVNPNATNEDVEKAITLGPAQVFAMDRHRAAQESYDYIQHRHDEILKIERSLDEVHQMFVDMAVLVDEQSEVIGRIAFQVSNVKADIKLATEELREANKIKRRQCVIQ
eukprot:TRINITY_DN3325_c0_g1_i1.p1 TRINITY_DN3325_c0_g1~~TRINITY_DN3325_c0_g1_i1.p1  ORF type:complete len:265 (+),score=68.20 TRINITY_DN3325_c0_g1_i1:236-1030(+)